MRWMTGGARRPPGVDVGIPGRMTLLSRWVMAIGVAAAVLYGTEGVVRFWPHQAFVITVLLGNGLLARFWQRFQEVGDRRALSVLVAVDVATVTFAIALTGEASADFYLFYFLVLLAAATLQSWRGFVLATTGTCLAYGVLLYADLGSRLWHESGLLMRIPFLLCVSIFVGIAAQWVRAEKDALDRTGRALAEIGKLAISWRSTGAVLHAIARIVQEVLNIDRCSLVLIEDDFRAGYLAASGDDADVDMQLLRLQDYPEILATADADELVELYPGHPEGLWRQVEACLPESSRYRSFLIIPVRLRDDLLGVYLLRSRDRERRFALHERTFCQVVAMMTATFVHERELQRVVAARHRRGAPGRATASAVGAWPGAQNA